MLVSNQFKVFLFVCLFVVCFWLLIKACHILPAVFEYKKFHTQKVPLNLPWNCLHSNSCMQSPKPIRNPYDWRPTIYTALGKAFFGGKFDAGTHLAPAYGLVECLSSGYTAVQWLLGSSSICYSLEQAEWLNHSCGLSCIAPTD